MERIRGGLKDKGVSFSRPEFGVYAPIPVLKVKVRRSVIVEPVIEEDEKEERYEKK
jgi:hypothetical protein